MYEADHLGIAINHVVLAHMMRIEEKEDIMKDVIEETEVVTEETEVVTEEIEEVIATIVVQDLQCQEENDTVTCMVAVIVVVEEVVGVVGHQ